MKILALGGAGYIGSHICKQLLDHGYDVIIFDNLKNHNPNSKIWGKLVKGDLCDQKALDEVFSKYMPDLVIHLASLIDVSQSFLNPQNYYTNNLLGSIHVMNAVIKWKTRHFIFSSSCAVYGLETHQACQEKDILDPQSPYGFIKASVETMIKDYAQNGDFNFLNLRYFNVAGLDQETGFIRDPHHHMGLIALLTHLKNSPFKVFGHDFDTPDKTAICDYVHVQDVAIAHLLACKYLSRGGLSQTLNIGSGQGHSVLDVILKVESLTGNPIPYSFEARKQGSSSFIIADINKAHKVLGFEPQFSDLKTIISSEMIEKQL
jgi:UDP-glucose-4-epimerase GalE